MAFDVTGLLRQREERKQEAQSDLDFDMVLERLDDIRKTRDTLNKANRELDLKLLDAQVEGGKYGIGVMKDKKTGELSITSNQTSPIDQLLGSFGNLPSGVSAPLQMPTAQAQGAAQPLQTGGVPTGIDPLSGQKVAGQVLQQMAPFIRSLPPVQQRDAINQIIGNVAKSQAEAAMLPNKLDEQRQEQTLKNQLTLDLEKQKQMMEGVGEGQAGRVALAKESIQDIQDVMKTLYPDGTPRSFRRDVATFSNIPRFGPKGFQTGKALAFNKDSQNVFRKMGKSLSGRKLIITGVAGRPDETADLVEQFAANAFSDPSAAFDSLNELVNFYKSYLTEVDPSGLKTRNRGESESSKDPLGIR